MKMYIYITSKQIIKIKIERKIGWIMIELEWLKDRMKDRRKEKMIECKKKSKI